MITQLSKDATIADCVSFIEDLAKSDKVYHLDDDPADIYTYENGVKHKRTFNESECLALRSNLVICDKIMGWDRIWELYYSTAVKAGKL